MDKIGNPGKSFHKVFFFFLAEYLLKFILTSFCFGFWKKNGFFCMQNTSWLQVLTIFLKKFRRLFSCLSGIRRKSFCFIFDVKISEDTFSPFFPNSLWFSHKCVSKNWVFAHMYHYKPNMVTVDPWKNSPAKKFFFRSSKFGFLAEKTEKAVTSSRNFIVLFSFLDAVCGMAWLAMFNFWPQSKHRQCCQVKVVGKLKFSKWRVLNIRCQQDQSFCWKD